MFKNNDPRKFSGEQIIKRAVRPLQQLDGLRSYEQRCLALFLLLIFSLLATGCFESKVVTSKVNDPDVDRRPTKMNGVFYALPRTVVKADVPVVRTDKEPGEFYAFTPCFFPNENYIKFKSTEFSVAKDKIKFDTLFIPDTEEIYMIKTQGGMFETRNLELDLTESGVLVKASAEVNNEAIDIVTGTIKTGVGLIAKASTAGLLSNKVSDPADFQQKLSPAQRECRELLINKWTEEINDASSKDEQEKLKAARPALLDNADAFKSGYEEAEKIVETIKGLQERRTNDVLNTTSPAAISADTFKLVLDELDKSITTLKQGNFTGTKSDLTWNASFRLNPEKPGKMHIDLFTLSKTLGVCELWVNQGGHNQGVQLDPKFKIKKECPAGKPACKPKEMVDVTSCTGQKVSLDMGLGEDGEGGPGGELFADKVKRLKRNGDRGFYYRIPGRAIASIKQEGETTDLARAPLSIAQFGEVVSLPASTGGRKTKYTLALYEASGGLKNFVMGSDALVKQKNIDDLTDAASTAIEAKGERKKAKAPADELQQLERQRKILEEKKKIRELEKEADETSPSDSSGSQ